MRKRIGKRDAHHGSGIPVVRGQLLEAQQAAAMGLGPSGQLVGRFAIVADDHGVRPRERTEGLIFGTLLLGGGMDLMEEQVDRLPEQGKYL